MHYEEDGKNVLIIFKLQPNLSWFEKITNSNNEYKFHA